MGCSRGVGVGDGTGDWVSLFGYATLSRSIDTVSGDPLMSRVKNLSAVLRILKGPLYSVFNKSCKFSDTARLVHETARAHAQI